MESREFSVEEIIKVNMEKRHYLMIIACVVVIILGCVVSWLFEAHDKATWAAQMKAEGYETTDGGVTYWRVTNGVVNVRIRRLGPGEAVTVNPPEWVRQQTNKEPLIIMSKEKFNPHCEGCKPVVIDMATGQPLPDDGPVMQLVMGVYNSFTYAEKESFHAVMVLNSRKPEDLTVCEKINEAVKMAMK